MMNTTTKTVTDTIVQTVETLLPTAIAAGAVANPQVASAVTMAPAIIDMFKVATAFANAGVMTPEQLATLFAATGKSIQSTHDKWIAMNASEAQKQ